MAFTPGNDVSAKIDTMCNRSIKFVAFAMGTPEDCQKVEDAITVVCKHGEQH